MKTTVGIFALALSIAAGASVAGAMPTDIYESDWKVEAFTPQN